MRIHRLQPDPTATKLDWRKTLCGKEGLNNGWPDEFDTVTCECFEARDRDQGVTCKSCLRVMANTP